MHYGYLPDPKRQPLRWPYGMRLAVIVTQNLEYWNMLKDTTEPHYAGGPPTIPDLVSAQPCRIRATRESLEQANSYDDVWWATREAIAEWYMHNHDAHIPTGKI